MNWRHRQRQMQSGFLRFGEMDKFTRGSSKGDRLDHPLLSIVIVSWNVCDLLRCCLHALLADQGDLAMEIIVVDGASADGSVAMVADEFPFVHLIASNENLGFPKGNNVGMEAANGRYTLLLNPDTIVKKGALETMLTYLQTHPSIGLVGAQLLNADGSVQSSRRRFPTMATAFFESTWLQPIAPKRVLDAYYVHDVDDGETAVVDWVMGACMMTRREIIETIGGMDEAYFMYSEELDWQRRINDAGWKVVYLPTAQVVHYTGKSSEQAVTARHINFQRAKLRYFRLYHGEKKAWVLRVFLLMGYLSQILIESVKGVAGHKRPLRQQRINSYWHVVRSGLRPLN